MIVHFALIGQKALKNHIFAIFSLFTKAYVIISLIQIISLTSASILFDYKIVGKRKRNIWIAHISKKLSVEEKKKCQTAIIILLSLSTFVELLLEAILISLYKVQTK